MRLSGRVRALKAAVPACCSELVRFVRGEEPVPDGDRCQVCGRRHVLVVREIVVRTLGDIERVRTLNAAEGRP